MKADEYNLLSLNHYPWLLTTLLSSDRARRQDKLQCVALFRLPCWITGSTDTCCFVLII